MLSSLTWPARAGLTASPAASTRKQFSQLCFMSGSYSYNDSLKNFSTLFSGYCVLWDFSLKVKQLRRRRLELENVSYQNQLIPRRCKFQMLSNKLYKINFILTSKLILNCTWNCAYWGSYNNPTSALDVLQLVSVQHWQLISRRPKNLGNNKQDAIFQNKQGFCS